jgi:hypothetical protein
LPAGGTGNLRCAPSPPPTKVTQLLSGPLKAPPRPAKGHPRGKYGGPVKCLNRPQEGPANRPYFAYKIYGLGSHRPGGGFFCRDPPGDHKRYTSEKWDEVRTAHIDQGGVGVPVSGFPPGAEKRGTWFPGCRRQGEGRGAAVPHFWTAVAVAPGRGRWTASGTMAGHQGQAALEDQGRKRSACACWPEVRTRGPGAAPPVMVTVIPHDGHPIGRSYIFPY